MSKRFQYRGIRCDECQGSGNISLLDTCFVCGGDGFIIWEPLPEFNYRGWKSLPEQVRTDRLWDKLTTTTTVIRFGLT